MMHDCYLWLDLETTGLAPDRHAIVEVGAIVTRGVGEQFERINDYHVVVEPPTGCEWSDAARRMHRDSGLAGRLDDGPTKSVECVDLEIRRLVREAFDGSTDDVATLAGRSPHFDRGFVRAYLPKLEAALHYRHFDVTTLRLAGALPGGDRRARAHRGLRDITADLELARDALATIRRKPNT